MFIRNGPGLSLVAYHEYTPEDNEAGDGDGGRWRGKSLSQGCKDDDDQFQSVHLLTTNDICEITEAKLTQDGASRGSHFDSGI